MPSIYDLVWPVATYGGESWTLRKNEETRLDAFEMKGLRKIPRISWTAKEINEWVLNKSILLSKHSVLALTVLYMLTISLFVIVLNTSI